MFGMPMGTAWGTCPIWRPNVLKDPTVKAKIYTWSSKEFRDEFALVYTSRYEPSQTCIFHCRSNRNKALVTLFDCLCEGNKVQIDIEMLTGRAPNGFIVLGDVRADVQTGSYIAQTVAPGVSLYMYKDKFQHRTGQLWFYNVAVGTWDIQFNTGFSGGSVLAYFIRVSCNPWRGIDLYHSGPNCEIHDYIRRPLGLCQTGRVPVMPPDDVMKQLGEARKKMDEWEASNNNVNGGPSSSTRNNNNSTNNAILNSGKARGNFNGANFRDCRFTIDSQVVDCKDLTRK